MFGAERERNRAIFMALLTTAILLVLGRKLFGLFWVVALGFAVICFTVTFAFFLRAQRGRHD